MSLRSSEQASLLEHSVVHSTPLLLILHAAVW
eukprot:CAMPEP_0114170510 /NCGR_PEP_ID=MMETSP0043_2-20121206/34187_1 /TAXON_ID=464988 /ORGANISM="Hemiselmis andersenii, Strain CCMP644" /LENGTH=31 /DNA_ID= /DNA_START= /DNA_END= /DNA_ORIENTATION=